MYALNVDGNGSQTMKPKTCKHCIYLEPVSYVITGKIPQHIKEVMTKKEVGYCKRTNYFILIDLEPCTHYE